jgi:hypothetical protein
MHIGLGYTALACHPSIANNPQTDGFPVRALASCY